MALVKCPECEKVVSTQAKICPYCGYPLKTHKLDELKQKLSQRKKLVAITCGTIAVVIFALLYIATTLTPYEKLAIENCNMLKGMLKSPDSFKLYDDILIYESDDYGTIMYIPYAGSNSFRAEVRALAQFANSTDYVGDYHEKERDDFYSDREYNDYILIGGAYALALAQGDSEFSNLIHINSEKIMSKID